MTLPNSSVAVSAGPGDTIAAHLISSKKYEAVALFAPSGHFNGTDRIYSLEVAPQVHVAAASTTHWDLFNADSTLVVRVLSIRLIPEILTAVTGVSFNWLIRRTTAVGTGGTAGNTFRWDSNATSLGANITSRTMPTGGATLSTTLRNIKVSSEETNTGTLAIAAVGGVELVPDILRNPTYGAPGIVLRQNQGIAAVQNTNSAAGNTGWHIVFTVE